MPLNDDISFAISPYVARTSKAVEFYKKNKDKNSDSGLMACIAAGPITGWQKVNGNEVAPLPSLTAKQLTRPLGFKRYKTMQFVVSDSAGIYSVGGITWKVILGDTEEEMIYYAFEQGARWLYVEAEFDVNELPGEVYRQVGLYSQLKIETDSVPDYQNRQFFAPSEILRTGEDPHWDYKGILEVYQNKYPVVRPSEFREIFSWVLEF